MADDGTVMGEERLGMVGAVVMGERLEILSGSWERLVMSSVSLSSWS